MNTNKETASMSGLPVLAANPKDTLLDESELLEAVLSHMRCKVRVRDYLDGKITDYPSPANVSRDDQCLLGKWIHGPGRALLGNEAEFNQLFADHKRFHMIVAEMVRHAQSREHLAADEIYQGEFQKISHKVKLGIVKLRQNIAEIK